jgi:mono/diheme cytochrome c family protein
MAALLLGLTSNALNADELNGNLSEGSIGGVIEVPKQSSPVNRGYLVFMKWCAGCHAPDYAAVGTEAAGLPIPGRTALGTYKLRQRYGRTLPAALEQRTDLTAGLITFFVRHGANLMPAFRKTELDDADLSNLVAYLDRNASAR